MTGEEGTRAQARIAELRRELQLLEDTVAREDEQEAKEHIPASNGSTFGHHARALIGGRAALGQYLEPTLFADPAFEILLFLFAAAEDGIEASTSDCCNAARVPRTTALRWIRLLQTHGLIVASDGADDKRLTLLQLSNHARQQIRSWFEHVSFIPARS